MLEEGKSKPELILIEADPPNQQNHIISMKLFGIKTLFRFSNYPFFVIKSDILPLLLFLLSQELERNVNQISNELIQHLLNIKPPQFTSIIN